MLQFADTNTESFTQQIWAFMAAELAKTTKETTSTTSPEPFIRVAHQSIDPVPVTAVDFGALVDSLNFGHSSKSLFFWRCKRLFDIAASLSLLVVLSPILLAIVVCICIESRGNPIFRQYRVGQRLKLFQIYKFRTMFEGVPDIPVLVQEKSTGRMRRPTFREDGRITRIGKFLRRWSLDELPQLFNVLFGEMSLVGPRPLTVIESTRIPVEALLRYSVPAGITGLGQVRDRNIIHTPERFDHDRDYVMNLSAAQECSILLKTFGAVIRGQ